MAGDTGNEAASGLPRDEGGDAEALSPLDRALIEYLEAVQSGSAVARDEVLARHLDVAGELLEHFALEEAVQDLGRAGGFQPRILGDYELLEEIGHGGMGVIYRARQRSLGRFVALKMVRRGELASADDRHRFRMEVESAAMLDHPNIVPIHEVGEIEGQPFFTMKLLDGGSLTSRSERLSGDWDEVARLVEVLACAVQYAHERGVLHRDLKPSNILFDRAGRAHVTDFGLAKLLGADQSLTAEGAVVGTPKYMAPEQARGDKKAVSTASDVYSLGVVLYELLAGRAPFEGGSSVEVLRRVLVEDPLPPRRVRADVPRDLQTIALKCLEKQPERRYPSARALAEDLRLYLDGYPITARPAAPLYRAAKWARRRPAAATLLLASLVALGALTAQGWRHGRETARRADELEMVLYATRMGQVHHALDDEKAGAALELLDAYRAGTGREALRDFGWWLALARCEQADWTFPCQQCAGLALLDGGRILAAGDRGAGAWRWELPGGRLDHLRITGHDAWRPVYCSLGSAGDGAVVFAVERDVWLVPLATQAAEKLSEGGHQKDGVHVTSDLRLAAVRILDPPDPEKDLRSGILLRDIPGRREIGVIAPNARIESWAMSVDGSTIAVLGGGALDIWDVSTRAVRRRIEPVLTEGTHASLAANGRLLAVLGKLEGTVTIWDTRDGNLLQSLGSLRWDATSVAFSPDGGRLAVGAGDGSVRLWRLPGFEGLRTLLGHRSAVPYLAFSADGNRLASWSEDLTVKVWDLTREPRAEARGSLDDIVWWAAFADGGKTLVTSCENFSIHVWDVESGKLGGELALRGRLGLDRWSLAREVLSPDGRRFAASTADARVRLWRLEWEDGRARADEEAVLPPRAEGVVRGITFSADSRRLAIAVTPAGVRRSAVQVWQAQPLEPAPRWSPAQGFVIEQRVEDMAFSPDRRWLALVARTDSQLGVYDLERQEVRALFTAVPAGAKGEGLIAVAFSADGSLLASGGRDQAIRLWDMAAPGHGELRLVAMLTGHSQSVTSLDFSAVDGRLISTSDDGTIRIWSLFHEPGEVVGLASSVLQGNRGQVKTIALAPGGKCLAVAGGRQRAYGEVKVYYTAAAP